MTDNGCEPVSDHCKAHNDEGDCTECYDGYLSTFSPLCIYSTVYEPCVLIKHNYVALQQKAPFTAHLFLRKCETYNVTFRLLNVLSNVHVIMLAVF